MLHAHHYEHKLPDFKITFKSQISSVPTPFMYIIYSPDPCSTPASPASITAPSLLIITKHQQHLPKDRSNPSTSNWDKKRLHCSCVKETVMRIHGCCGSWWSFGTAIIVVSCAVNYACCEGAGDNACADYGHDDCVCWGSERHFELSGWLIYVCGRGVFMVRSGSDGVLRKSYCEV